MHTMELYDILKGKNALVKSVYYLTEYAICNLVHQLKCIIEILQYMMVKIEGKVHPRTGHEGPEGKKTYGSTLSLTMALDGGWVDSTMPWPLYPWDRDPVHIVQGTGWALGPVWMGAENSQTVQPVESCYTDYAILALQCMMMY